MPPDFDPVRICAMCANGSVQRQQSSAELQFMAGDVTKNFGKSIPEENRKICNIDTLIGLLIDFQVCIASPKENAGAPVRCSTEHR
ncbi:hypothetical protein Y601_3460 [Burkholderia pseudomallei MSHR640]|nr:hypothetical protein Y601_3460 [Burkholderia pseudomallei MSHR640]